MLVGSHRQLIATAQAAALKNRSPISRGHAVAESMHAHTAADFRLVYWPVVATNVALAILLVGGRGAGERERRFVRAVATEREIV